MGVVQDYTLDYAGHEFSVQLAGASQDDIAHALGRYAGAYQRRSGELLEQEALDARGEPHRTFVVDAAKLLISFIYEHIELARRRALNEMLQAVTHITTGEDLRRRILDYLQQSEWDDRLEEVRASRRGGMDMLGQILDDLATPRDAASLRGALARLLGSYPDIPGLLILRALAEVLSPDAHQSTAAENIAAGMRFALAKLQLEHEDLATAVGQVISRARDKPGAAEILLEASIESPLADREFVRALMRSIPQELMGPPATWLNQRLAERCALLMSQRG
jgi:hypothetical protein